MSEEKNLSRREFEAVMRRAAELANTDPDSGDVSEDELYRIAKEVGIPDRHVRIALAHVRSGQPEPGAIDRMFGPELVLASRVVPGTPQELSERLDRFMVGGRLLQTVRRGQGVLQYRPAVDWISQVARVASATSRRYYVASARSVEVRLDEVEPGRTLVGLKVDPGTRGEAVGGSIFGGVASVLGGGVFLGLALATVMPAELAVAAGSVVGGGVGTTIGWAVARKHRQKVLEVHAEVEGILDQLEGDEPLEPPPPSWRNWVRRQYHGARKLIGEMELDDPTEGQGER